MGAMDIFDEFEIEILAGCRPKSRQESKKPLAKARRMGKKSKKNLH